MYSTLGDTRWTPDLLLSTWWQAEWGNLPYTDLEYRTGASGGGFDKLRFLFPKHRPDFKLTHDDISLELEINRRGDGRPQIKLGGALVRRRHVLRVGFHQHHPLPGPGRQCASTPW